MSKKRYYDENCNQIRSRPEKSLYKKVSFWLIVVFSVTVGAVGMDVLTNNDEVIDEIVKEDVKKEVNEKVEEVAQIADPQVEEEQMQEDIYTYDDFKGTYVTFEGEPYKSPIGMSEIVEIKEDTYRSFDRWELDMTSPIVSKTIDENMLKLDLDSDENEMWGLHSESGTEQFELHQEGDVKALYSITNDRMLYSMTSQDLQNHYTQKEIDYARIFMTVFGEPSLDQWAVWEDEWDKVVINIRHNSAGDPTEVSEHVTYPEDVTHLDLTNQGMAWGIVTYSSQSNGKIMRYPMPLHYHQEDQSEEGYRQVVQGAIDGAYEIDIEPFDPYTVADFIGNIDFVYK